jgi:argininosuccinate lyase
VRGRIAQKKDLAGITIAELRAVDPRFAESAVDEIDTSRSLASRSSPGGTAPERVRAAIEEARTALIK